MADYIRVSSDRIEKDRERIQTELQEMSRAAEELAEEMQSLGQTWEGPAWKTFQKQVADAVGKMQDAGGMLAVYIQHMEYAKNEYGQCENQINHLIDSIRV